ncbi:hypothetical protein FOMPIDRAFT_89032 [Fomitopsis schrenkii]|uniref:Uncharacterized protein n=1 Tax=Fomitopsis schrenkii TaxID=2126942 RepID=S8EEA4_FOMSC|nr:hypothetical protein FOMPIDRAFT_89032 [Fomitopsis schrenkii]
MHAVSIPLVSADYMRGVERLIVVFDVPILCMLALLGCWAYNSGAGTVWRIYFVPWLWAHNWRVPVRECPGQCADESRIVTVTYLQHSDPTILYYRWAFLRGALATVDRPVFGWAGRFFY